MNNLDKIIEDLALKYSNDNNGKFHLENTVSIKYEIIKRELKNLLKFNNKNL